jgi:hypothetical protein
LSDYGWPEWLDLKTLSRYACKSVERLRADLNHPTAPLPFYQEVMGEFISRQKGSRPASGPKIYVRRSDYDAFMEQFKRSTINLHV